MPRHIGIVDGDVLADDDDSAAAEGAYLRALNGEFLLVERLRGAETW